MGWGLWSSSAMQGLKKGYTFPRGPSKDTRRSSQSRKMPIRCGGGSVADRTASRVQGCVPAQYSPPLRSRSLDAGAAVHALPRHAQVPLALGAHAHLPVVAARLEALGRQYVDALQEALGVGLVGHLASASAAGLHRHRSVPGDVDARAQSSHLDGDGVLAGRGGLLQHPDVLLQLLDGLPAGLQVALQLVHGLALLPPQLLQQAGLLLLEHLLQGPELDLDTGLEFSSNTLRRDRRTHG
ncbi:hypothetical protein CRUP_001835 [Coryphaenoides rupestris]|nr:hypothetical protein CRUP_001835 [Coryphaenoides rupestris]